MPYNPTPSDEERAKIKAMMARSIDAVYQTDSRVSKLMADTAFATGMVEIVNTGAANNFLPDRIVYAILTWVLTFLADEQSERVSNILLQDVFGMKEIDLQ